MSDLWTAIFGGIAFVALLIAFAEWILNRMGKS